MLLRRAVTLGTQLVGSCSEMFVLRRTCVPLVLKHGCCYTSVAARPSVALFQKRCDSFLKHSGGHVSATIQTVRHLAQPSRRKKVVASQLDDLAPSMLKTEYAAVPLANATDDLVKRLLSLEMGSHRDRLRLKEKQLVSKVRRDEHDCSSREVKVAVLTARIRNYQEHLQKHPKDKANKRRMLMAVDQQKKHLKFLQHTRHDTFEFVCQQLGITYTPPPLRHKKLTKRYLVKKELCTKVFQIVQGRKLREKLRQRRRQKQRAEEEAAGKTLGEEQQSGIST